MTASPAHPSVQLVLASKSPRRRRLLECVGLGTDDPCGLVVTDPPFDDPGTPEANSDESTGDFATRTALQKALSTANLKYFHDAVILTADTVCVNRQGQLIGKPGDRDELLAMLRNFVDTSHQVVTGMALLRLDHAGDPTHQESWHDAATVSWGHLDDDALLAYANTDHWQGKAGGYNLEDRVKAGWPITVDGDEATVMGLPIVRLLPRLQALGVCFTGSTTEATP